jgi:mono/diheme cytochrome c family protein
MLLALFLTGCAKVMQDMYDQAKYEPLESSSLFANSLSSRTPIGGTVAQSFGTFADTSSGRIGASMLIGIGNPRAMLPTEANNLTLAQTPIAITSKLLQRGKERYNIYCSPCHSRLGDGDGMVVRRGFPRPPSYHTDELRQAPLSHFYRVITQGYGVMYSYADRITPHDRWAIAAYIRALQLSQHARLADLPASVRFKLESKRQ